jgi:hypothetical protein
MPVRKNIQKPQQNPKGLFFTKYMSNLLGASNASDDSKRVSFHKARKLSTALHER